MLLISNETRLMELINKMELYSPNNAIPVLVSIALFALQTVLALMDTNTYIKDMGIIDTVISKGKFLYSYVAGFYTYFIKLTVQLFSLFVLVSVIRVVVVTVFNILRPLPGGAMGKAAEEFQSSMFAKIKEALKSNILWLLGIYLIDRFLASFAIFGPVLLFFAIMGFSLIMYYPKGIQPLMDEGEDESAVQILNTYHHHMMFFISLVVTALILYILSLYALIFAYLNPVK